MSSGPAEGQSPAVVSLSRRALLALAVPPSDGKPAAGLPRAAVDWEAAALDAAVFAALRAAARAGDTLIHMQYAAAMEDAYGAGTALARRLHADTVNAAFAARLGLCGAIAEALAMHPHVAARTLRVFVELARTAGEEDANLRDLPGGPAVLLALRPELFGDLPALRVRLAHELAHLNDLLDPAFGRVPGFDWPGPTRAEKALQRDRYRALWCCSVDARLRPAGAAGARSVDRRAAIAAAFRGVPARLVDAVVSGLAAGVPTHALLLAAAEEPRALVELARRGPDGAPVLAPAEAAALAGAARRPACALCGFPTVAWSRPVDWTPVMVATAHKRSPAWDPAQGACDRCRECFELRAGPALPNGGRA